MAKILIVDDSAENRGIIKGLLGESHTIYLAKDGSQALRLARTRVPDLILMDVVMPVTDGYEACRILKGDSLTADIPIIFLTSLDETDDETRGLELGAVDYITKPITPAVLKARVRTHLELKASGDLLKLHNEDLEEKVLERTRQLEQLHDVTVIAMSALAESRDFETGYHIRRTQYYVEALAQELRERPGFSEALTPESIVSIVKSTPLHDIGKIGIPDRILQKPGKLTEEEFEIMKQHTIIGRDAIIAAERSMTITDDFLQYAKEITCSHHERWDGTGYPEGLQGSEIPLSARMMAIADVYDALICRRVYKPPFSHEQAVKIITEGRGTHFDPDMVDAFLEISDQFRMISKQFSETE